VILISTHILPDVQSVCDQVVMMVGGRVRLFERLEVLARPSHPAWQLRVIGDPAALRDRLQREGIRATVDSLDRLVIAGLAEGRVDCLWQWAREAGVGVRSLVAVQNSLEDVFLAALQEHALADS
jgi:ABC-2 type transport system ATP-binding protein